MPLSLKSSGGGSVTLDTPSTASTYTLTVPAINGTAVVTGSSGTVSPTMLSTGAPSWNSSGVFSFNSGYGSVATAYGCRAWVNFNGIGTVSIRASGNVSSITDVAAGAFTVNFTTAMPDSNYSAVAVGDGPVNQAHCVCFVAGYAPSSVDINFFVTTNSTLRADPGNGSVAVFR
jgi:hypothetical protein